MSINVSVDQDDANGVTRIVLAGELDIETSDDLHAAVELCLRHRGCSEVRVDLARVTFCDSVGLGALIATRTACMEQSVDYVLVRPHPNVHRVLTLTRLETVFQIEE